MKKAKILIAAADDFSRLLHTAFSSLEAYETLSAVTGHECRILAIEYEPDLIVIDERLPDMSGADLCRRLKSDRETSSTRLLLMHSSAAPPESEADGYLLKPFAMEDFLGRVRELLASQGAPGREERTTEHSRLAYIFEHSPALIAVVTGERRVFELVNPAFQRLAGERDLVGQSAEVLDVAPWRDYVKRIEEVYETGKAVTDNQDPLLLFVKTGDVFQVHFIEFTYQPILDKAGRVSGVFTHGSDVSHQIFARARGVSHPASYLPAVLSHELRTSLTPIIDWADVLRGRPASSEDVHRGLHVIDKNARDLDEMIRGIRSSESGALRYYVPEIPKAFAERSAVEIKTVVMDAVEGLRPMAEQRGVLFDVAMQDWDRPVKVIGDTVRLKHVFHNLMQNAIKFSDKGGRVRVACRAGASAVQVQISDEGRGIAHEEMPYVFDPFHTSEKRSGRPQRGLGLTVARELVELHGGRILAESEGANRGATFTVELPASFTAEFAESSDSSREVAEVERLTKSSREDEQEAEAGQAGPEYKRISAWIEERVDEPARPLFVKETYTLCLRIGTRAARGELLVTADAIVPESDIPENGLDTKWLVKSHNVEIAALPGDDAIKVRKEGDAPSREASFTLHIPKRGPSETRRLLISPQEAVGARVDIIIFVGDSIYREFSVELNVAPGDGRGGAGLCGAARIVSEMIHGQGKYVQRAPPHEWQTPPGVLNLIVSSPTVMRSLGTTGLGPVDIDTSWNATSKDVVELIRKVREKADDFRSAFTPELNDIDRQDLNRRLLALKDNPGNHWADDLADGAHREAWEKKILNSKELRDLAREGNALYLTLFPHDSELRKWIDSLAPGWRLYISWRDASISHIPWGLLYTQYVEEGVPVDPTSFWGLRFRVDYIEHPLKPRSPALGSFEHTRRVYALYWGKNADTAAESQWQQEALERSKTDVFVSGGAASPSPKAQLLSLLKGDEKMPTPMLYFFCYSGVSGGEPTLRFDNTSQPPDELSREEIYGRPLADQPLVFVNACDSASSDPYEANELAASFFLRGCRAYLGTEAKVPIQMASRFARIFYSFFYREVDSEPITAGEALYQTRRFLWREYRNLGGLFYTYINHPNLYMAEESELN